MISFILTTDILDEIQSEITMTPDEREHFNFFNPKVEKLEEDLWCPKKITPTVTINPEESYRPKYPTVKPTETFVMMVPSVRIIFEIEQTVRIPVLMMKVRLLCYVTCFSFMNFANVFDTIHSNINIQIIY